MVELYPEARKVLDAAREARTPTLADRERVFASLMASVAVGAAAPSAAAAKTGLLGKIASNALWIKAAASVAVLSVASVSTLAYVRHRAHPPAPAVSSVAPRVATPVAAAAPFPAEPPVAVPAPSDLVPAAAMPAPAAPPVERAAPVHRPADGLSAELALLRQAHEARRAGQPARALELAREHAKKYPHSQMWAERETLRVLSLCDLGRVDAARRTAAPLQYLWSSPLRATLNASCVGK